MEHTIPIESTIQTVNSFQELMDTPFEGSTNAMCWNRKLEGDFGEIVRKLEAAENITVIHLKELQELELTLAGSLARDCILKDLEMLEEQGAAPVLNIIKNYTRDEEYICFPTDVYSFHVDRSPVPADTILCTYFGASSELISNDKATQKILIPEIRDALFQIFQSEEDGNFEDFLSDYFFDLHYEIKANSQVISLGTGHLWKLAIDHPEAAVLPCVHRAPIETNGESRLLLIC